MKKILISMVCIMMMGIQSVNAQIGIAVLHHEGNSTVFKEYSVAEAITAAVDGDTLYLSEGHFKGGFTINKAIHVIGSGQGTLIDGNITISFENNPTLSGYLLTGLYVKGNIVVNKAVKGLGISQCQFTSFGNSNLNSTTSSYKITELYMERCYCSGNVYLNIVEGGSFNACKIYSINSINTSGQSSFNHCNVRGLTSGDFSCYFINCIYGNAATTANVWQNCLCTNSGTKVSNVSTCENCWDTNGGSTLNDNLVSIRTDEQLQSSGYIATDGTVIGITGGETPYTLELATPKVVEHNIEVDKANKKLNVTLTVGNE